jgi:hypothetical protein
MSGLVSGDGASRLRAVVLLGDEPPIPTDGVGCDDSGDVREAAPVEDLAFHGQAAPLVVGEAKPSRTVRCAEETVLLEQVANDRLLVPVDPAGEEQEEEGDWGETAGPWPKRAPRGRPSSKGASLGCRSPADRAEVPEAQASSKGFAYLSKIRPRPRFPTRTSFQPRPRASRRCRRILARRLDARDRG